MYPLLCTAPKKGGKALNRYFFSEESDTKTISELLIPKYIKSSYEKKKKLK